MQTPSVEIWWTVVLGISGTLILALSLVGTIVLSQRKEMKILAASEEKFHTLFDNSLAGMFRYSFNGNHTIEANRTLKKMFGLSNKENPQELNAYLDSHESQLIEHYLRENGTIENYEVQLRRKDQSYLWVSLSGKLFEEGEYIEGVIIDISERKKIEAALGVSEEKYRTLFEEMKDAVFVTTPDGKFLDANPAAVELFGVSSKEELFANNIQRNFYVHENARAKLFEELLHNGFVKDYELIIKKKDRSILTILATVTPVFGSERNIVAYRKVFRDVTATKRLEAHLRQAQKMERVATLACGIAHDFNNLLGIILINLEPLEQKRHDDAKFFQYRKLIVQSIERGAALVKQMLTFAGKTEVSYELIDITSTIHELRNGVCATFPKNIEWKEQLDIHLPSVFGDKNQMYQVFLNLCLNARDAMPDGGTLSIAAHIAAPDILHTKFSVSEEGQYIEVIVADTGIGMSPEIISHVFEPFFTTKGVGKGTGLGLAVTYGIMKNFNGFIDVQSEVGKGTTFSLYFPVTKMDMQEIMEAEKPSPKISGNETILVIEDEEALLFVLKEMLEENGYKVITAGDGKEAVEKYAVHKNNIALIISDMGLPKLSGVESFRLIKEINPFVKVIFASGFIQPQYKTEILQSGVKKFVHKPYTSNTILHAVRTVLDEA